MPQPIQYSGEHVDMSPRFFFSTTALTGPAGSAETAICSVTCAGDLAVVKGVQVIGSVSLTIGTSGALLTVSIRRTNAAGTLIYTGDTETVTATQKYTRTVQAIDTGATLPGQVYVLTVTVGSGAATSAIDQASLTAFVY